MPKGARIGIGERLPQVEVAELIDGEIQRAFVQDIFAGQRVIIVGIPGAFTPICSRLHIPKFVKELPALRRSGFDQVVCIAPSSPWALHAWAQLMDPLGSMRFLSDGNLAFGRAAGVTTHESDLFMGECFERFVLMVRNCIVEKISVERSVLNVSSTSAASCLLAA